MFCVLSLAFMLFEQYSQRSYDVTCGSIDRFTSRSSKTTSRNGVSYPYMGTTRHFHVVFDVRVLDLNLSNGIKGRLLYSGFYIGFYSILRTHLHNIFYVCFDVMYSGEYNLFDATLSVRVSIPGMKFA
jgi:hypothetical protein